MHDSKLWLGDIEIIIIRVNSSDSDSHKMSQKSTSFMKKTYKNPFLGGRSFWNHQIRTKCKFVTYFCTNLFLTFFKGPIYQFLAFAKVIFTAVLTPLTSKIIFPLELWMESRKILKNFTQMIWLFMSLLTIIFDLVKVSALPQVVVRSQSLLYPNQPGRQIVLRSVTGTIYVTLPLSRGICHKNRIMCFPN